MEQRRKCGNGGAGVVGGVARNCDVERRRQLSTTWSNHIAKGIRMPALPAKTDLWHNASLKVPPALFIDFSPQMTCRCITSYIRPLTSWWGDRWHWRW